jgi:hypothetical protein
VKEERTLLFTGYARLPGSITASRVSDIVGVGVEVEEDTGLIVDAECTLATRLASDFFRRLVVGHRLEEDFAVIVRALEDRYHGSAQKALITALKAVLEKYLAHRRAGRPASSA